MLWDLSLCYYSINPPAWKTASCKTTLISYQSVWMLKEISETIYWLNWFNKLNQDESERVPEVFSLRPFSLWTKHSSLLSLKKFHIWPWKQNRWLSDSLQWGKLSLNHSEARGDIEVYPDKKMSLGSQKIDPLLLIFMPSVTAIKSFLVKRIFHWEEKETELQVDEAEFWTV